MQCCPRLLRCLAHPGMQGKCRQSRGEYARCGPRSKPSFAGRLEKYAVSLCLPVPTAASLPCHGQKLHISPQRLTNTMHKSSVWTPSPTLPRAAASVPCQGKKLHTSPPDPPCPQQQHLCSARASSCTLACKGPNVHKASVMLTCPACSICALPGEEAAHQPASVKPDAVPNAMLPLPLSLVSITSLPHSNSYWCPFPCCLHGACKCLIGCDCQARCLRVALQGWRLRLAQQPLMFCRGQGRPSHTEDMSGRSLAAGAGSGAAAACALQDQCREA